MTETPNNLQPWDQMPGERDIWYKEFQRYLSLGFTRTFLNAYRASLQERGWRDEDIRRESLPPAWREQTERMMWLKRAELYDRYVAKMERRSAEELIAHDARRRRDQISRLRDLMDQAIRVFDPEMLATMTLPDLLRAWSALNEQSRAELALAVDITKIVEGAGTGHFVVEIGEANEAPSDYQSLHDREAEDWDLPVMQDVLPDENEPDP